jgi:hypothetical protein
MLVSLLRLPAATDDTAINASQALIDIVICLSSSSLLSPAPLVHDLLQPAMVKQLFAIVVPPQPVPPKLVHDQSVAVACTVSVITVLLQYTINHMDRCAPVSKQGSSEKGNL